VHFFVEDVVLADKYIHLLIGRFGALVDCEAVTLVFGCSEPSLRHPLLDSIPIKGYRIIEGPPFIDHTVLFQHDRILAACDIAIQTGKARTLTGVIVEANTPLCNLTIAPLERPGGILGLVLFFNARSSAFSPGEHFLLRQYLPEIAQRMEAHLIKIVESARKQAVPTTQQSFSERRLPHEFLSMLVHELRSPLTAIKGYAALLQAYGYGKGGVGSGCAITEANRDEVDGESESDSMSLSRQREYLDIIMEQVDHLEVLIADILDISHIQSGQPTLRASSLNCVLVCQRTLKLIEQQTEEQHPGKYTFRSHIPAGVPLIWADTDRLQQILTNLLENAVKYSPDGGQIELVVNASTRSDTGPSEARQNQSVQKGIDAIQSDEIVVITVQDWGIGIPEEQQQELFLPFRRLANATSREIPGVGLGLYITRRLVEAMAGTISVSSNEKDGTKVMVVFPAVRQSKQPVIHVTDEVSGLTMG
jgi:signal transduction histidine kinase